MTIAIVNVFTALSVALLLYVIVDMLRRRKLRERHAIWWLLLGFFALLVTLFPQLLDFFADLLGVQVPLNLAFFAAIVVLFLVSIQQSKELTKAEERTRILAEHVALLEDALNSGPSSLDVKDDRN